MSTRTLSPVSSRRSVGAVALERIASGLMVPVGRALFAAIFILAAAGHFSPDTIRRAADQGVPFAHFLVPASGVLSLLGGLSVLLGYRTRLGATLLVLFLIPVTFAMHAFWAVPEPQAAQVQMVMFMKNVGLTGGAMLLSHFGAGPHSLDARREATGS